MTYQYARKRMAPTATLRLRLHHAGPEALDMSKLESSCSTSPTVHSRSSGHSSGWTKSKSVGYNGGCVVLKQLEKNEFNKSALSLSQLAETLLCDKVGLILKRHTLNSG